MGQWPRQRVSSILHNLDFGSSLGSSLMWLKSGPGSISQNKPSPLNLLLVSVLVRESKQGQSKDPSSQVPRLSANQEVTRGDHTSAVEAERGRAWGSVTSWPILLASLKAMSRCFSKPKEILNTDKLPMFHRGISLMASFYTNNAMQ